MPWLGHELVAGWERGQMVGSSGVAITLPISAQVGIGVPASAGISLPMECALLVLPDPQASVWVCVLHVEHEAGHLHCAPALEAEGIPEVLGVLWVALDLGPGVIHGVQVFSFSAKAFGGSVGLKVSGS